MKKILTLLTVCLFLTSTAQVDSGNDQVESKQTQLNQENIIQPGNFEPIEEILGTPSRSRALLWDQYDTDGSNGLSIAHQSTFGSQRDLLDDFEVPAGQPWVLTGMNALMLWNTLQPGAGTDFALEILYDNGGAPGALMQTATTASYLETPTGRTFFGRPEFQLEYGFDPIVLSPGTYWIRGHINGPENCFWMARSGGLIWGSECWTDYEDFPPLGPSSVIFGVPYDLAFQLTGELGGPVPLSNYAIIFGVLLIIAFSVFRYRRMI